MKRSGSPYPSPGDKLFQSQPYSKYSQTNESALKPKTTKPTPLSGEDKPKESPSTIKKVSQFVSSLIPSKFRKKPDSKSTTAQSEAEKDAKLHSWSDLAQSISRPRSRSVTSDCSERYYKDMEAQLKAGTHISQQTIYDGVVYPLDNGTRDQTVWKGWNNRVE